MATCIFVFSSLLITSDAQTLTIKDFKLYLDDIGCSDSIIKVSKQGLLNAHKITPNFSWLNIKALIIYIGEGKYRSEVTTVQNKGNFISEDTKKFFKRLSSGSFVTIEVEGYNKKGIRVPWPGLSLIVTE